jgi:hypothetical protein
MICSCQAQVVGDINRATQICLSVGMLLLLTGIVKTSSQARWLWSRLPTSASCRSTRRSFYPCLINACMLALNPNNPYTLIIQALYSTSSLVSRISCQQHAIDSSARSRCAQNHVKIVQSCKGHFLERSECSLVHREEGCRRRQIGASICRDDNLDSRVCITTTF